jgi:hypothetical protein
MIRQVIVMLGVLSLTGCATPGRLGISENEWQNYSPDQQAKIKAGYYELLRNKLDSTKGIADGSVLHVKISGGQVNMPPFAQLYNYTPIEFDITSGESRTITFKEENGKKKVDVKALYSNKTLYLDPSRYDVMKRIGSIQLHYSPIWDRGFSYQNVSSSGYAHLTNVNVALRKYDKDESIVNEN